MFIIFSYKKTRNDKVSLSNNVAWLLNKESYAEFSNLQQKVYSRHNSSIRSWKII